MRLRDINHGTRYSYAHHKCRCAACTTANSKYYSERRVKKKSGLINIEPHKDGPVDEEFRANIKRRRETELGIDARWEL